MYMRMMLAFLLTAAPLTAAAAPLSDWLVAELTAAMDAAETEILPERRALLLDEAAAHARGYRVMDLHPCHLDEVRAGHVPRAVQYAASDIPIHVLRYQFVVELIRTLHASTYETVDRERVAAQIDALAAAYRKNLADSVGHFIDEAMLDESERAVSARMHAMADRCIDPLFKSPLPDNVFEPLREEVRGAPLEEEFWMRTVFERHRWESGAMTEEESVRYARRETQLENTHRELGKSDFRDTRTLESMVAAGEGLIRQAVALPWMQHTDETFHAPGDREIRHARLEAALEAAGAGVEAGMNLFPGRELVSGGLER